MCNDNDISSLREIKSRRSHSFSEGCKQLGMDNGYLTVSEACERLGLDMDKLRYLCVLAEAVPFQNGRGELGIGGDDIWSIKGFLDDQRCRQNLPHKDKDSPWD